MSTLLDAPLLEDPRRYQRDVHKAWEEFMATGRLPADRLRFTIVESWQRCRQQRLDPHTFKAPTRQPDPFEVDGHLLQLAPAVVGKVGTSMRMTRHLIAVCDAQGVILAVDGDPGTVSKAMDVNIATNGVWAEDLVGTNGIGTSLQAVRPVQVYATEHFCAGWQDWTCSAAPIRDPETGAVVGGVNISSYAAPVHPHTLSFTASIARELELELHVRNLARSAALYEAFVQFELAYPAAAVLAVNLNGRLDAANTWARRLLPAHPRLQLRAGVQAAARSHGPMEQELILPDGRRIAGSWHPVRIGDVAAGAVVVMGGQVAARPAPREEQEWPAWAGISSRCPRLRAALQLARKAAVTDVPVLVLGETGTGKELVARAIHNGSRRAARPFVAVNCGALAPELVVSELFGYEPGAFTGAARGGSAGQFEQADGGTLLLDEVGDLPPQAQGALLRVLETGEVLRVGSKRPRRVNVRLIAATNWDLQAAVQVGRFRKDLYYRLNTVEVHLPPLRERPDDIPALVRHFLAQAGQAEVVVTDTALAALRRHPWPGNIRELRAAIQRALLLQEDGRIGPEHLALRCEQPGPGRTHSWEESKRQAVTAALAEAHGNVAEAARRLGVSRNTVYKFMRPPKEG